MSIVDRIKNSVKASIHTDWSHIVDITELNKIDELSKEKPVVIFKHSVTCGISSGAKYRLESEWDNLNHELHFYYLDLLAHREVSNAIAERYDVVHQSPQILIIKKGKSMYDTSHHRISINDINEAIDQQA